MKGGLLALLAQHRSVPEEILVMPCGMFAAVIAASFGTSRPEIVNVEECSLGWSQILQIIVLSGLLCGDGPNLMLQGRRRIYGRVAAIEICAPDAFI